MVLPEQDKYASTRAELLDQLAYMMGGRAAESWSPRPDHRGQQRYREGHQRGPRHGHPVRHDRASGRHQAGQRRRRTLPRSRLRAPATTPRTSPRSWTRRFQAHQQRPPEAFDISTGHPRGARRPGAGAVREGDPGPGGGRRGVPAAVLWPKRPAWTGFDDRVPSAILPVTPPPPSVNGQNLLRQRPDPARARRRGAGRRRTAARASRPPRPSCPVPATSRCAARTSGDRFDDARVQVVTVSASESPLDEVDTPHAWLGGGIRPPPGRRCVRRPHGIGENLDRDGLRDTPERVARAYAEMFAGLRQQPEDVLATVFDLGHDEFVLVKDTRCGAAASTTLGPSPGPHVGYIPNRSGKITGRAARLAVDLYASGLRCRSGSPPRSPTRSAGSRNRAVIVVIECEHLCMTMRGVRKPGPRRSPARSAASSATPPPAPRRCS